MTKTIILSLFLMFGSHVLITNAQTQTRQRCEATTKKGTRCKNNAIDGSKYCYVHQAKSPSVEQCKATTKSGSQCSRAAKTNGYCTQHYKLYIEGKLNNK